MSLIVKFIIGLEKLKTVSSPALKFIEINLALSLTCSYEIVLKKWVYLPCNSKFLLFKSIFVNYLWMYFEIKYILNNLYIIICWIFLGWLFHVNAVKWYLSKKKKKKERKHCAFGSVFHWLGSCFITFVFCQLQIWDPPRYCWCDFLYILLKIVGQIC